MKRDAAQPGTFRRLARRYAPGLETLSRYERSWLPNDFGAGLFDDRRLTLAAISSALGYSDPAHFTTAFARWTGMTPRAYRRRGTQQTLVDEKGGHDPRGSRCRRDGTR